MRASRLEAEIAAGVAGVEVGVAPSAPPASRLVVEDGEDVNDDGKDGVLAPPVGGADGDSGDHDASVIMVLILHGQERVMMMLMMMERMLFLLYLSVVL